VFEAIDKSNNRKVALKRIEKVGTQLSREYEILFEVKDSDHVVKILVPTQVSNRISTTPAAATTS
jgi:glycogen synthase kinase 3 beta